MKVSVFGLGYVGCVSAACLAQDGHEVVGVDVDARKVSSIANGLAPFFEPGLEQLLAEPRDSGRLRATTDDVEAIRTTDAALICVGTPSERTGEIKLDALRGVLTSVGAAIRNRSTPFVVILRSTVLPHVVEGELIPLLERSARKRIGEELHFSYNPEFLREGTAIRDFYEAPMVVIGHNDPWAAAQVAELYSEVPAPVVYTDIATACMVKYVCNVFHALKVSFANEIGQLSESLNVDGRRVMEIICMDTKLNISPMYLKPGFAFGGSCLPKDLRAVVAESRRRGIPSPVIQGILPSNKAHLESCIDLVLSTGEKSIGLFGLTFKEGTDDLRESPAVALAETLLGKGIRLSIYEPAISHETIHGANLAFIERNIPHIWKLLTSDFSDLLKCNVVVLLKKINDSERAALQALTEERICIDFANTLTEGELKARTVISGLPHPEPALA
ncbi:MAG: nucleotide sugar dehydrogenase [Acidobacteriaceae bacterium]|nr:nucleotide sugar dehydrogenase [Acidobacteriaceae bacterium]